MKMILLGLLSLLLLSCDTTTTPVTFSDLNENVLCEGRKVFNDNRKDDFGQPIIESYLGFDVGCSNAQIEKIKSNHRSYYAEYERNFEYDDNNKLILLEQTNVKNGNTISTSFDYDASGNLVQVKTAKSTMKLQYDNSNHISSTKVNGNLAYLVSIMDLFVSYTRYSGANEIAFFIHKQYNNDHQLILEEYIDPEDSSKNYKKSYSYDQFGNQVKLIEESANLTSVTVKEYNKYGLITKKSVKTLNAKETIFNYRYQLAKHQSEIEIKQERIYADSSGRPLVYVFDVHGNWVNKKNFSSILPVDEVDREIIYR